MPSFSPEAIYERGRQKLAASQPRNYELLRQMIAGGLALCIEQKGWKYLWLACAPWSRLEPNLFLAQDLATEGDAGLHRIEFGEISISDDIWGSFLVAGNPVASFRPISHAEEQKFVDLWNARSGQPPIQLVDF